LFAKLKKIIEEFFVNVNFVTPKNSAGRIHPVNAISFALTRRIRITCNLKLSEDGGQESNAEAAHLWKLALSE
jgi:hypothetical protein